uniref:Uncharacterized protein n=1 Tax=viral metagenome TaxID=1070528 RepID=A0A6C0HIH3_9ZZZZ
MGKGKTVKQKLSSKEKSFKNLSSRSRVSTSSIKKPTAKSALKLAELVFKSDLKIDNQLLLLSESEITKVLDSLTPETQAHFTIGGILHSAMLLKRAATNKHYFENRVAIMEIMYGKTFDLGNIKTELNYIFKNNDDKVRRVSGGAPGVRSFSLFTLGLVLCDILCFYIYHRSYYVRLDMVGYQIGALKDTFNHGLVQTSGWDIDKFYKEIYGEKANPSNTAYGWITDGIHWAMYSKAVRDSELFQENKNAILEYIILSTNVFVFRGTYNAQRKEFQGYEDKQFRKETLKTIANVRESTISARQLIFDESIQPDSKKKYSDRSMSSFEQALREVDNFEADIRKILQDKKKSANTNIDLGILIDEFSSAVFHLQNSKKYLEKRVFEARGTEVAKRWEDISTVTDLTHYIFQDSVLFNTVEMNMLIAKHYVNLGIETFNAFVLEPIQAIVDDAFESMNRITMTFLAIKEYIDLDIPSQYTIIKFIVSQLFDLLPIFGLYLCSLLALIYSISREMYSFYSRPLKNSTPIDNDDSNNRFVSRAIEDSKKI